MEITETNRPGQTGKLALQLGTAGVGGYGRLLQLGAVNLGFVADSVYTYIRETDKNTVSATSGWARAGLNLDYDYAMPDGARLGGKLEMTWRRDFGAIAADNGLEVGGKLDLNLPNLGLRMDVNARALLAHDENVQEWGINGSLTWAPRADGHGLSVVFKPQWGAINSAGQQLWDHGLSNNLSTPANQAGRYELSLRYGLPIQIKSTRWEETLSFFARGNFENDTRDLALGADFKLGESFSVGYETIIRQGFRQGAAATADANTDHRARIQFEKGF